MTDGEQSESSAPNMWDHSAKQNDDYRALMAGSANYQAVDPMLDAAHVAAGTRMLDIGTGMHAVAVAAALHRGAQPTGTDIGAGIIESGREEYPGVPFW